MLSTPPSRFNVLGGACTSHLQCHQTSISCLFVCLFHNDQFIILNLWVSLYLEDNKNGWHQENGVQVLHWSRWIFFLCRYFFNILYTLAQPRVSTKFDDACRFLKENFTHGRSLRNAAPLVSLMSRKGVSLCDIKHKWIRRPLWSPLNLEASPYVSIVAP